MDHHVPLYQVKVKENRLKMADKGYFISAAFHQIHAKNSLYYKAYLDHMW